MKIIVLLLVILGLASIVTGSIVAFFAPLTTRTIASHEISPHTIHNTGIIRHSNSTEGLEESNSTENTCQKCANSIGYIPIAIGLVLLSTALVEKKRK